MKCHHQHHSPHLVYAQPQSGHQHQHVHAQPSSPSNSAAVHGASGAPTCCACTAVPNTASNTLPAHYGLNVESNACNYRTRTLPNMTSCSQSATNQFGPWIVSLSPRALGLFALSLVFVLIWSTVISGVLVTHSLKEHETAIHTADLFELHKHVGQFAFEVGQEMLLTLNSSLTAWDQWTAMQNESQPTSHDPSAKPDQIIENVQTKWNSTDLTLEQVRSSLAAKGYPDFESDVQSQLEKLRFKCAHQVISQWPSQANQTLYPVLVDCVRAFQQSFQSLDTLLLKDTQWLGDRHSKLAMTDLVIRQMPYTLFVRGLVHRFTSLGLGLILVRSNFSHPFNMSEYFHHYFTSRQLIESSFVWNYRFLQRYLELERTDYQADMLLQFFDARRAQERDFYLKMSSIFSRMFSIESLKRIRSYIKKKNVESVERLLVNGSKTKFVADQDANAVSIQLDTDLIELMGLDNIEQVTTNHEQMLSSPSISSELSKYDQLLRNQIGFMSRVQGFLNNSISTHLAQTSLNEKHNLMYHSVVAAILCLSVLICLALFLGKYCCSRPSTQCYHPQTQSKSTFGRRMRRRLWNLSSPFSLFKSCFSTTSQPRYPLLYKSSHQTGGQCHTNSPNQMAPHSGRACNAYCSSPNSFLMSTSSGNKRSSGASRNVTSSGFASTKGSAGLSYKFEKSRHSNGTGRLAEASSLMGSEHPLSRGPASTSSGAVCCLGCSDQHCNMVVTPCHTNDPGDGCRQCAATGKCSTCCPFNRNESCSGTDRTTTGGTQRVDRSKHSSKQSLHSSTLSIRSESKDSSNSTAKEKDSANNSAEELDSP